MVSDSTMDSKLTKMSLAVAKDSGWYEVDLSMGENYFWGKDEGCDIFANTCSHTTVSEFCAVARHRGCSDNHMYKTYCAAYVFTGTCPINLNVQNCTIERASSSKAWTHGKESVCLNTEVKKELKII